MQMAAGQRKAATFDKPRPAGPTLSDITNEHRPLDSSRVMSSARIAQPSASALRATAYPSLAYNHGDRRQDLFQHSGLQMPPQKQRKSAKMENRVSSPRSLRGATRGAFGPRLKAEQPCSSKHAVTLGDSGSFTPVSTMLPVIDRSGFPAKSKRPSAAVPHQTRNEVDATKHSRHRRSRDEAFSVKLDQEVFRNFWPLLDNSRDYARLSGCRFRSRSFDGIAGDDSQAAAASERAHSDDTDDCLPSAVDTDDRMIARAHAAPTVYRFAERLRAGETELLEELDKAFRIVMAESVRSAMIATCQVLELWPPSPAPAGVADDDCAFEDVSSPVPVIAQRLHNDEKRRQRLTPCEGDMDPMRRRAMMATYIVEFASAAGTSLPELPTTYDMMLSDFKARASQWEQAQETQQQPDTRPQSNPEQLHRLTKEERRLGDGSAQVEVGVSVPDQSPQASIWPAMLVIAATQYSAIAAAMFNDATPDCGSRAGGRMQRVVCT